MIDINILQSDSRKVKDGDVFIALKGLSSDGHDYINRAILNGASKIIASKRDAYNFANVEYVDDTNEYLNNILINSYLPLYKDINFIGITGTNGKTTTCYLIYQMLNELKSKTAYIGTMGFYDGENIIELNNTTPDILELYKLINIAYQNKCANLVMEVSSHALDQERIKGIKFNLEAFTNLTQDHLDYHKTMDNYLATKLKIIDYLTIDGKIIVNVDDSYGKLFINSKSLTLGINGTDYRIINFEEIDGQTLIKFSHRNKDYNVKTNLISKFNVYNYLMALAITNNLGYEVEDIISITEQIYPPKGRVESIKVGNGFAVVDYAHTPDAVEKIIEEFKIKPDRKVITVIGCGGDRDHLKRPIMGNIATKLSDHVIFTSDNPRTEDPDLIIADIVKGATTNNYEIVIDRHRAINQALQMIEDNEVVLILGKGHEEYQEINNQKHHFSDVEEVNRYLNK